MGANFEGMERDNAERAAGQLADSAIAVVEMIRRTDRMRRELVWHGENAKAFTEDWDYQFLGELLHSATVMAEYSVGIREALAMQKRVSGEDQ
jgi:hypothetical protein